MWEEGTSTQAAGRQVNKQDSSTASVSAPALPFMMNRSLQDEINLSPCVPLSQCFITKIECKRGQSASPKLFVSSNEKSFNIGRVIRSESTC